MSSRRTVKQTGTLVHTIHAECEASQNLRQWESVSFSTATERYCFYNSSRTSWFVPETCVVLVPSKMFKRKDSIKNNLSRKIWWNVLERFAVFNMGPHMQMKKKSIIKCKPTDRSITNYKRAVNTKYQLRLFSCHITVKSLHTARITC